MLVLSVYYDLCKVSDDELRRRMRKMIDFSTLLNRKAAAEFLGVCEQTITSYYLHGYRGRKLRAIKRARRPFFDRKDLEAFLQVTNEPEQSEPDRKAS